MCNVLSLLTCISAQVLARPARGVRGGCGPLLHRDTAGGRLGKLDGGWGVPGETQGQRRGEEVSRVSLADTIVQPTHLYLQPTHQYRQPTVLHFNSYNLHYNIYNLYVNIAITFPGRTRLLWKSLTCSTPSPAPSGWSGQVWCPRLTSRTTSCRSPSCRDPPSIRVNCIVSNCWNWLSKIWMQ